LHLIETASKKIFRSPGVRATSAAKEQGFHPENLDGARPEGKNAAAAVVRNAVDLSLN
jgi:hypothetical protein